MLPNSAKAHYRKLQRLQVVVVGSMRRAWRRMEPTGNWERQYQESVGPQMLAVAVAGQIAATREADSYVADVLNELDFGPSTEPGVVNPRSLAGWAGDGRPVRTLLEGSVVKAGRAFNAQPVDAPPDPTQALQDAEAWIDMVAQTLIADANRAAEAVAITTRPWVDGWVRMLNPPSCARCAVLAGRFYLFNEGFLRHPQCFPAGVTVSGPSSHAATRRFYQGELVIIRTASGQELPVTGNHPILTDQGWVPANLIQEGDHVVRSLASQGAVPLVVPDEQQAPSLIEDCWRSDRMVTFGEVPTTAEDFHGDGGHGEVDVVLADRLLRSRVKSSIAEVAEQSKLTGRIAEPATLTLLGSGEESFDRLLRTPEGVVRRPGLRQSLGRGHAAGAHLASLGSAADLDAEFRQALANGEAADLVAEAEAVLALTSTVRRRDVLTGQRQVAPRWDAPTGPLTEQNRPAYAGRGRDLSHRLAGQVAPDRVVEVRRVSWSGHVYNLTSAEGWYSANGLIVSNCDCLHIPAPETDYKDLTVNPDRYFHSLSEAEQDRIFTNAGAEAIRNGADLTQVVNARRGMRKAQIAGRDVLVTTEGTTRRGVAYGRLTAGRDTDVKSKGERYARARRPRLMPETILEVAEGRDDAVRLLKANGYIL